MTESPEQLRPVLERSRELGFLGPGDIEPQLAHAHNFLGPIQGAKSVLDLGSGGGLPGLVLAVEMKGARFTLLDSHSRRCTFLESAIDQLGLSERVSVANGRAEELARTPSLRGAFDAVVSRSFGPPAVTAECAVGFLNGIGATIAVSEPPDQTEDRWNAEGLDQLGLEVGEFLRTESGGVQVLQVIRECSDRFPRRVGIPRKRPLF